MLMEHDIELKVNYMAKDCFDAVLKSVSALNRYEVTEKNEIIGTIQIKVKGLTASPGDFVSVTVYQEAANITNVIIRGGVKIPYYLAKRNCIKNAEAIATAFANQITKYQKVVHINKSQVDNSVENNLERLKNMYQKDLISQEEYEQKKKEILDCMFK